MATLTIGEIKSIISGLKKDMRTCSNAERRELRSTLSYFRKELAFAVEKEKAEAAA